MTPLLLKDNGQVSEKSTDIEMKKNKIILTSSKIILALGLWVAISTNLFSQDIDIGEFGSSDTRTAGIFPNPLEMMTLGRNLNIKIYPREVRIEESALLGQDRVKSAFTFGRLVAVTMLSLNTASEDYLKRNFSLLHQGAVKLELPKEVVRRLNLVSTGLRKNLIDRGELIIQANKYYSLLTLKRDLIRQSKLKFVFDLILAGTWIQTTDLFAMSGLRGHELGRVRNVIATPYVVDYFAGSLTTYKNEQVANSETINRILKKMERLKVLLAKTSLSRADLAEIRNLLKEYLS